MKLSRFSLTTLLFAAGAIGIAATVPTFAPQDPEQPTEHHARLLEGVGEWEGTLTAFMPDVPAEKMAATETARAVGGFWLQTRFECDFGGMAYVGTGVIGYDTKKGVYRGTWADNMSSYLAIMEGKYDEKLGGVVMRWEAPGPDGKMAKHRHETVAKQDHYTSTFYMGEGEDAVKTMVIEMKRKAEKAEEAATRK